MKKFNREEYIKYVKFAWKKRVNGQGIQYNSKEYRTKEVEFFVGAMPIFFVLGIQDQIPASWVWRPMGNQNIMDEDEFND
jgi:hypothetical protein